MSLYSTLFCLVQRTLGTDIVSTVSLRGVMQDRHGLDRFTLRTGMASIISASRAAWSPSFYSQDRYGLNHFTIRCCMHGLNHAEHQGCNWGMQLIYGWQPRGVWSGVIIMALCHINKTATARPSYTKGRDVWYVMGISKKAWRPFHSNTGCCEVRSA